VHSIEAVVILDARIAIKLLEEREPFSRSPCHRDWGIGSEKGDGRPRAVLRTPVRRDGLEGSALNGNADPFGLRRKKTLRPSG
jgi:hypothetical protein